MNGEEVVMANCKLSFSMKLNELENSSDTNESCVNGNILPRIVSGLDIYLPVNSESANYNAILSVC